MDKEFAIKIIRFIGDNMERESRWLYPEPDTIIHNAESLLFMFEEAGIFTKEEIISILNTPSN